MGSQYLINQSLYTQSGSQDVCLSVHSTGWHTSHTLITRGDTIPLPQAARERAKSHILFLFTWLLFVFVPA